MTQLIHLPLSSDLVDTEGVLAAGQMKRVSGATKIDGGVMSTVRGNRTQLVNYSADLTQASWAVTNVTKDTATTCTFDAQNGIIVYSISTIDSGYYVFSFKTRRITGNTSISINHGASQTGTSTLITDASVYYWDGSVWQSDTSGGLASTLTRYYIIVQGKAGGGTCYFGLKDTNAAGHGQVEFTEIQVEKLEGPSAPPGVELIADQTDRDFNPASTNWANVDIGAVYNVADDLTITANAIGQSCTLAVAAALMTSYQAHLLEFDVANIVGSWTVKDFDSGFTVGTISANGTNQQIVFSYADASSGGLCLVAVDNNSSMDFDNVSLKGITFPGPLEPGTYTATAGATATIPAEARFENSRLLLEHAAINYVGYSQDSTKITGTRSTITGSQSDLAGNTDAWKLVEDDTAADSHLVHLVHTYVVDAAIPDNTTVTVSIRIKKGGTASRDWVRFIMTNRAGNNIGGDYNINTGVTGTAIGTSTLSITSLGDDWYKLSATRDIESGASTQYIYIYIAEADNDVTFDGDSTTYADGFIVHGIQLEPTAYATSYIPTTGGYPVARTTEAGSSADNGVSWTIVQALKNILDDAEPVGSPTDSEGTLLFEVKWGCDESAIGAGNKGIVSVRDSALGMAYFDINNYIMYDTTNGSTIAHPAFSAGDIIYYASRWGDVDGNADDISAGLREAGGAWSFDGTPGAYDGEFTLGTDLRLSFGNIYPIHISDIKFLDTPLTQGQLAGGSKRDKILTSGIF